MFSKKRGDNMNRLKELREKKKLTLKELSQALKQDNVDISPDSLAKYERGERKPKYDKWLGMADFYNVPVPYLQGITFNKTDVFEIISKSYSRKVADPFLTSSIDQHLQILGMAILKETFTTSELSNFAEEVKNYFEENFQFIFLTDLGKECLYTEKSTDESTLSDIVGNFVSALSHVDTKLESTSISNIFDKDVNDKLVDYCQHKDVFLRIAGKTDIMQKTYKLATALVKFANDIEDFPENSLTPPEIARKRLKKFVDSGGKTFE